MHPFLAALLAVAADSAAIVPRVPLSPTDSAAFTPAAPSDTLPREVRRFPPIEVAAGRDAEANFFVPLPELTAGDSGQIHAGH